MINLKMLKYLTPDSRPVRISGPFVSRAIATGKLGIPKILLASAAASLTF